MSIVIITIRDDVDGDLDVKCELEPPIRPDQEFEDIPFTHKLAMSMMQAASAFGGGAEVKTI